LRVFLGYGSQSLKNCLLYILKIFNTNVYFIDLKKHTDVYWFAFPALSPKSASRYYKDDEHGVIGAQALDPCSLPESPGWPVRNLTACLGMKLHIHQVHIEESRACRSSAETNVGYFSPSRISVPRAKNVSKYTNPCRIAQFLRRYIHHCCFIFFELFFTLRRFIKCNKIVDRLQTRLIIDNVEFHLVFESILIFNLLSFNSFCIDCNFCTHLVEFLIKVHNFLTSCTMLRTSRITSSLA